MKVLKISQKPKKKGVEALRKKALRKTNGGNRNPLYTRGSGSKFIGYRKQPGESLVGAYPVTAGQGANLFERKAGTRRS